MSLEKKSFEIKAEGINDLGEFTGLASVYGNEDLANDIIVKGAFTGSITKYEGEVVLLWQHKTEMPIGLVKLADTDEGLKAHGFLNLEVEKGREALALLKQGALKGMSIGFITKDFGYAKDGYTRLIKDVDLKEISLVTFPCNEEANVDLTTVKEEPVVEEVKDNEVVIKEVTDEEETKNNQELDTLVDDIKTYVSELQLKDALKEIREGLKKL